MQKPVLETKLVLLPTVEARTTPVHSGPARTGPLTIPYGQALPALAPPMSLNGQPGAASRWRQHQCRPPVLGCQRRLQQILNRPGPSWRNQARLAHPGRDPALPRVRDKVHSADAGRRRPAAPQDPPGTEEPARRRRRRRVGRLRRPVCQKRTRRGADPAATPFIPPGRVVRIAPNRAAAPRDSRFGQN